MRFLECMSVRRNPRRVYHRRLLNLYVLVAYVTDQFTTGCKFVLTKFALEKIDVHGMVTGPDDDE